MRPIIRDTTIFGYGGNYGRDDTSIEIVVTGANDTEFTHRGEPVWRHDEHLVTITSDDPESPLYGEEIRVPLKDLLGALKVSL